MDWYRPPPRPTTDTQLDERIEWDWFHFWHHEGRQARHGASMIGPCTHSRGIREVAERIHQSLVPAACKLARAAEAQGRTRPPPSKR
jgi:hydroxylamine dehydrogenase